MVKYRYNEHGGGGVYKVVIIDDEPIIVEGLAKAVDWEKQNCVVVGTAQNGMEGMQLIREKKPNIVFSDICMPNMDGLTMIAGLKSEFPSMQISILTGFRDFDYAQQAIHLGVVRYLLKPSKMDEIDEALKVMVEKLAQISVETELEVSSKEEASDNEGINSLEENAASSFIVKNALQYIEDHYKEKILLSEVADNIFVSQWHLSKLLNKHMGQNFSEILNNVRIDKAKGLLKNPSLRIGEIAENVGFLDMAHFSRVFKKIVGISANEYRNTVLAKTSN